VTPFARREAATILVSEHRMPVQPACLIVHLSRAAYYRPPVPVIEKDAPVIAALNAVLERRPRMGFWKCVDRVRRNFHPWNHKRLHRVYTAMGLNQPRRLRQSLDAPPELNQTWAMDFMTDALYGGRKFRTLNILDEGNREGLAIDVAISIPSRRVIRQMEEHVALHGPPKAIRVDNGPEFIAEEFVEWCKGMEIEIRYIQPGKPDQNAYIERFNRSYRQDVLDAFVFGSLGEARLASDEWLKDYNTERPHDSLGRVPPLSFLSRDTSLREYTFELST
jgi:putative transposase